MLGDRLDVAGNSGKLSPAQRAFQFEKLPVCFAVRFCEIPVVRKYAHSILSGHAQRGLREYLYYIERAKQSGGLPVERIHNGLRGKSLVCKS